MGGVPGVTGRHGTPPPLANDNGGLSGATPGRRRYSSPTEGGTCGGGRSRGRPRGRTGRPGGAAGAAPSPTPMSPAPLSPSLPWAINEDGGWGGDRKPKRLEKNECKLIIEPESRTGTELWGRALNVATKGGPADAHRRRGGDRLDTPILTQARDQNKPQNAHIFNRTTVR